MNGQEGAKVQGAKSRAIPDDHLRRICNALPGELFEGKCILATGVNGFLGRWLIDVVAHLNDSLRKPVRLIGLDSVETPPEFETLPNMNQFTFIRHDIVKRYFGTNIDVDYIIHMAGIASPYWYQKFPLETIDVAVSGTRNLLELAQEKKAKFLFTSSSEVYQTADVIPTPETYIGAVPSMGPRSCYDVGKLMGETLANVFNMKHGVHTNVVRIFNAFGPHLRETDYRILPKLASSIVGKRPLNIYHPGANAPRRTYCYAGNTIYGLLLALARGLPGEVYNIGVSSPEIDVEGLVRRAELVTGNSITLNHVSSPVVYTTEPTRRCPDINKAMVQLWYTPLFTLEEGLETFFNWAIENYTGAGAS